MYTAYKVKLCLFLLLLHEWIWHNSEWQHCWRSYLLTRVLFPLVFKGPHLTNRILFRSSGLTNAILEEKDLPEELPRPTEDKQDGDDQENGSDDQENGSDEKHVIRGNPCTVQVFKALGVLPMTDLSYLHGVMRSYMLFHSSFLVHRQRSQIWPL